MPNRPPDLESESAYLDALRDPAQNLLERYREDPEGLATILGLKLPEKPVQIMQQLGVYDPDKHGPITPGLREMVLEVCMLEVLEAVGVGPRGGGKSQGVSFIEFFLWMLRSFDALNLGGSELQAANVYHYLLGYIESNREWTGQLKGEPKISETEKLDKAWIRVLAASSKSVRSPHAGGIRRVNGEDVERGGLLVCDEEAEADPGIVEAAMYTINTARPSVNVRTSTFHNAEGSFAEAVENHEEMGYKIYQWDAFDVCEPCECTGGECQSSEKCFREDHYELMENPDTGVVERALLHKAYCGGRAQYAQGWIPVKEIEATWRRGKRNHAHFEVEAMGSRPKSSGYVIKDLNKFESNRVEKTPAELYQPGAPVTIDVDWGAVNAGLTVWQVQWDRLLGERHVLLHADPLEEAGVTQVIGSILRYWTMYPEAEEVRADIGGGGMYLNPLLRNAHSIPCEDVNFAEEKEAAVAVWNILNESGATVIPHEHDEFRRQVRKWKRKNGRIAKGDDHLCDSSVCHFSKFIEVMGLSHIRITPRGFDTSGTTAEPRRPNEHAVSDYRVPVVRGLSSRK
jgi:hypothetical protein